MTEIPLLQTHAVSQPSPRAPFAPAPYGVPNGRPLNGPQQPEDDNVSDTIKCVCGYELDDGSSVLCELCRTWQHVLCYYDNEAQIPRVHECADCHPRPLEQRRIKDRQKTFRDMENVLEKKHKRPAPKSHKKKPKDTIVLTNGHDEPASAIERKSGSPRDPQPPAKRPKTTHKSSGSVASLTQPSSRKRATSTAQPVLSPVKSPATPIANGYASDYFSEEFLRLYEHCDFAEIEANSFRDLGVTNSLHLWLKDPEETAKATGGKTPDQIFQRHDGTMKSLEETGPHLGVNKTVGALPTIQGPCPTWMWITVDADVPRGGFVGELKGQIGLRDEYCSNPDNRWPLLRHPRPFVFFPPSLPIYIDTRYEGTHLRYIRRSCRPNVRMQILITGESQYHFCFIATADIFAGDEITLGWDIDKDIQQALQMYVQNGNTREGGIQEVEGISHWVAGVLSNFGGCACSAVDCPLARCDRRNASHSSNQILKPHKKRKNGSHVSPLSTGQATNSRAGSEARRVDQDDDNVESRSVSGSTRSKPTSRDMTPMTHASTENAVGLGVEMSDREKRKLMQQEKLFEQLEHNEQHAQKKRKRNSAGSALNTPSVASSKQLGLAESSVPSPAAPKSRTSESNGRSSTMNGRRSNNSRRTPRTPKEPVPAPKPEYADQGTQTDPDPDCPSLVPVSMHVERRKPKGSFLRSLLQRTRDARVTRERSQSTPQSPPPLQPPGDRMEVDEPENPTPLGQATLHRASSPQPKVEEDVEMQDASTATSIEAPKKDAAPVSPRSRPPEVSPESPSRTSHPPLPPPPPPWLPTDDASAHNGPGKSGRPSHVDLPPLPTFSTQRTATQTPPPPSVAENTPPARTVGGGAPVAESPSHLTPSALAVPAPSPDVSTPVSVATPSPVQRKAKMSLSDWTAKRKAKLEAKSHEHDDKPDERDKEKDKDIPSPATTLAPLQESSELKDGEQKANVGAKAEGKATDSA